MLNFTTPIIVVIRNICVVFISLFLYLSKVVVVDVNQIYDLEECNDNIGMLSECLDYTQICSNQTGLETLSVIGGPNLREKSKTQYVKPLKDRLYGFDFNEVKRQANLQADFRKIAEKIEDKGARNFFIRNAQWVVEEAALHGILPSGKMAQGMLESNYAKSNLAIKANNYFGIKDKSKRGYPGKDDEYYCPQTKKRWHGTNSPKRCKVNHAHVLENSSFMVYQSAWESWRGHSVFLKSNSRYKKVVAAKDFNEYCNEIGKSGYATDPNYGNKIRSIVVKWNLQELDRLVMENHVLKEAFFISKKRR